MAHKFTSINLLKKKDSSFLDKFIKWSLTIGRIVVIVTELIALSAFLYRFSLDRKLIDLHEEIEDNQNLVKLLKKDEDKYRNLQSRLAIAARFGEKSKQISRLYQDTIQIIPSDFQIGTLTISEDILSVQGQARSVTSLATFIRALKENKDVNSISIDRLENKTSSGVLEVGISVFFKNLNKEQISSVK